MVCHDKPLAGFAFGSTGMKQRDTSDGPDFRGAKMRSRRPFTRRRPTPARRRPGAFEDTSSEASELHERPKLRKRRSIRATDSEWKTIAERAREAGMTRTAYLLAAALSGRPRQRPNQPTRDAIYHLARLGNNLNQISRAANTPNRIVDEGKLAETLAAVSAWIEAHA